MPIPTASVSPGAIPPVRKPEPGHSGDDPVRGILLVSLAMVSFAVSDTIAKHLSASLPAVEIAWLRWIGFVGIMAPFIIGSRGAVLRSQAPWLQVGRCFGLVGSAFFFILGLHYLPLATSVAIAFASPLLVTALSIPFLGERVGPRRWAAVLVGLVGVLIVVRPGTGALGSAAILPLLSAVSWAFGMIFTRKISMIDPPKVTMSYSALGGLVILSVAVPFDWHPPTGSQVGLALFMAAASTTSQFLIVIAYRHASASLLAPISYSQLVWSGLLGLLVFGNVPDGWTLVGASVIIGSGIYTAHRERVTSRDRAAGATAG